MSDISDFPVEDQHCAGRRFLAGTHLAHAGSHRQSSFRGSRNLPEVPSAWIFSHRPGCLAGEAEHRTEPQALGCGGPGGSPSLWAGQREGERREGMAREASSWSFKGERLP